MVCTGLSNTTVVKHIANWNENGMKAIVDHRVGSDSKIESQIVDDILYIVTNKSPIDFDFTVHTWTWGLLVIYVEQTYGIKVCQETIRQILISHEISYKRAQPKPTKADKQEQEPVELVFIRAPYVLEHGKDVKTIVEVDGKVVGVRQNKMIATSFHPELTDATKFLEYVLKSF